MRIRKRRWTDSSSSTSPTAPRSMKHSAVMLACAESRADETAQPFIAYVASREGRPRAKGRLEIDIGQPTSVFIPFKTTTY